MPILRSGENITQEKNKEERDNTIIKKNELTGSDLKYGMN